MPCGRMFSPTWPRWVAIWVDLTTIKPGTPCRALIIRPVGTKIRANHYSRLQRIAVLMWWQENKRACVSSDQLRFRWRQFTIVMSSLTLLVSGPEGTSHQSPAQRAGFGHNWHIRPERTVHTVNGEFIDPLGPGRTSGFASMRLQLSTPRPASACRPPDCGCGRVPHPAC